VQIQFQRVVTGHNLAVSQNECVEMTLLGIDIGSSFIKGGVLDLDELRIRDIVREPFPDPISGLPTGYFEVDRCRASRDTVADARPRLFEDSVLWTNGGSGVG
jgi:hypothetical protein